MSQTSTARRKGGQPGNTNSLRHGLYSKRLLSAQAPAPSYDLQLNLYRRRLAQLLARQEHASVRDYLSFERGILQYISLILELKRWSVMDPDPSPSDLADGDGHPSSALLEDPESEDGGNTSFLARSLFPIRTSDEVAQIPAGFLLESLIRTSSCSSSISGPSAAARSENEPDK